jgi:ElaB/YqjD/DUF883 family membrane-anchored ribosome-binding protein
VGKTPDDIKREIEGTREQMGETVEALAHKADVPSLAKQAVAEGKDKVVERVTEAKDSAVQTVAAQAEHVRDTARKAGGIARENPLGLAVGSVAVGFLAGVLVPSTKVEDRKLGPVADEVKERAKETGEEAVQGARDVARETAARAQGPVHEAAGRIAESARQAAQRQGQELASSTEEKAKDVAETARQAARS